MLCPWLQTQRIDPQELNLVLPAADAHPDSEVDEPIFEVQQNALPDVYPLDDKK